MPDDSSRGLPQSGKKIRCPPRKPPTRAGGCHQEAPGGNRGITPELMRRLRLVLSARFRSRLARVSSGNHRREPGGVIRKPSARAGGMSSGSPRWKPGDHAAGQWSQPARGFETGAIRKQSKGHARRRSRGSIRAGGARSVAVSFACRRIP